MNDTPTKIEAELTEALAAEDVPAALEELLHRHAADAHAGTEIRRTMQLVGQLRRLGQGQDSSPVSPYRALEPPRRRACLWPAAAVAAAAAAAILLAVFWSAGPGAGRTGGGHPVELAATVPAESAPSIEPSATAAVQTPTALGLQWPTLEIPDLTTPQIGEVDRTFTVPAFSWPSLSERSEDHDT